MQPPSKRQLVAQLRTYALMDSYIHGVAHWARVCRYGEALAERIGLPADYQQCVSVFGWTHDLARFDDSGGIEHAIAGAEYLDQVAPAVFPSLSDRQIAIVRTAIQYHSHGYTADAAREAGWFDHLKGEGEMIRETIACCWDADRLDLLRLGIEPNPERMSTSCWRELLPLAKRLNKVAH